MSLLKSSRSSSLSSLLSSGSVLSSAVLLCESPSVPLKFLAGAWNMYELECICKDTTYPSIDDCIQLKIGAIQHFLDVLGIDFNDKILNSNDIKSKMS